MAAIKEMTASNPRDRVFYEYVLAQHSDWFAHKIKVGVQAHGLPSTEITAAEIEHFEHSFCLKLQIVKTPQKTASADIDTLLDGGTGPGIFSAADIAAEKAAGASEMDTAGREDQPESSMPGPTASEAHAASMSATQPLSQSDRDPSPNAETPFAEPHDKADAPRRFSGKPKGKGTIS